MKAESSFSLAWLPYSTILTQLQLPDATKHLLGASKEGARFAVSVSTTLTEATTSALQELYPSIVAMDLRALLMVATREDAAIAGHAVALTSWHTVRLHKLLKNLETEQSQAHVLCLQLRVPWPCHVQAPSMDESLSPKCSKSQYGVQASRPVCMSSLYLFTCIAVVIGRCVCTSAGTSVLSQMWQPHADNELRYQEAVHL